MTRKRLFTQVPMLLCATAAEQWGMPYSVQDLTNPGIALAHSAGFAARLAPIRGVEANARQFLPDAQRELRGTHEGLFEVREGRLDCSSLGGTGLGYGVPA